MRSFAGAVGPQALPSPRITAGRRKKDFLVSGAFFARNLAVVVRFIVLKGAGLRAAAPTEPRQKASLP